MKTAEAAEEEDERRSAVAIGSARSSTTSHKPKEKEKAVAGRQWAVSVAIISGEIVRRVEDCRSGRGETQKKRSSRATIHLVKCKISFRVLSFFIFF